MKIPDVLYTISPIIGLSTSYHSPINFFPVSDTHSSALPASFLEQVHEALKTWNAHSSASTALTHLRLVQIELAAGATNPRRAVNNVLLQGMHALDAAHDRDAALLRLRFMDGLPVRSVASRLNAAEPSIYRWQSQAIEHLAALLWQQEQAAVEQRTGELAERLEPATYLQLFGLAAHQTALLELLFSDAPPSLIAIEGGGGIGKTSLADAVLRAAIRQRPDSEVAWVSARRQRFDFAGRIHNLQQPALTTDALLEALAVQMLPGVPRFTVPAHALAALRAHFAQQPTLVVVDNLETAADVTSLLPLLRQLAGPAKFLLTTRYSLYSEPGVYHLRVPELNEPDALALVRLEAQQRNLPELSQAGDAALHPIYQTVGGNPLALRLVVGQAHVHSLHAVLADLAAARGAPVESLYTYIYKAAWSRLGELPRRALLAMPLVSERSGTLEILAQISGLERGELSNALTELVMLNLVDGYGLSLAERRYTIHALTRTFLLEQVAKWL